MLAGDTYQRQIRRYERILVVTRAFSTRTYLGIWAEYPEGLVGDNSVLAAGENWSRRVFFRHVVSRGHHLWSPAPLTDREIRLYRRDKLWTGRPL